MMVNTLISNISYPPMVSLILQHHLTFQNIMNSIKDVITILSKHPSPFFITPPFPSLIGPMHLKQLST